MQWLTAILAFATTMLIFAMVVSAIVEVIHRTLGSRTFGLIAMLEYYYDEVLVDYFDDDPEKLMPHENVKAQKSASKIEVGAAAGNTRINREEFLQRMIAIRAPGISKSERERTTRKQARGWQYISWFFGLIPYFFKLIPRWIKIFYSKISGTSKVATELGNSSWRLLNSLPVETFMERLGTLGFAEALKKNTNNDDEKNAVLKDIAQKFELYGRESTLYFETKARTISMVVAMFVAWTFYVHPYQLLQTYMTNPAAAAKVAALGDSAVQKLDDQKKILVALKAVETGAPNAKAIEDLLKEIEREVEKGKAQAMLLNHAGAPVGWPVDLEEMHQYECFCGDSTIGLDQNSGSTQHQLSRGEKYSCQKRTSGVSQCKIIVNVPNASRDIFWLLIGGVLIGLGAPFWAKIITQIAQLKNEGQNIASILKPEGEEPTALSPSHADPNASEREPLTTKAFNAAADARELKQR